MSNRSTSPTGGDFYGDAALEYVLSHFKDVIQTSTGHAALCPVHDDTHRSLSFSTGSDGRILFHCHAGCSPDAILATTGLGWPDMYSDSTALASKPMSPKSTRSVKRRSRRTFPNAAAATQAIETQLGKTSFQWEYQNIDDQAVGVVLRWDSADGKTIRPIARDGDAWIIGAMSEPRPLYKLPSLRDQVSVCVTEGEKAADALWEIGIVATTSSGGASAAQKTDWAPLAGMLVFVFPDNDEPGETYAATVADILVNLSPPATVKIVRLPGLPAKGDVYDWIEARDSQDADQLRAALQLFCDASPEFGSVSAHTTSSSSTNKGVLCGEAQSQAIQSLPWRPFPLDQIPSPLREYLAAKAGAIDVDVSQIVLPMLSALGAAIGNTRRLHVHDDWNAPPILWTAVVCESGSAKTPAMNAALRFTAERQAKAWKLHLEELADFDVRQAYYERSFNAWKRNDKTSDNPPEKPVKPLLPQFRVSDCTVEALAIDLLENLRGLLLARDELSGWFCSHDRYTSRGGGDQSAYLEMYNAGSFSVNRKTSGRLFVPRAAVCVTGTIQPAILRRLMGTEQRENGMQARFLWAFPPRRIRGFPAERVDPLLFEDVAAVFDGLWNLDFQRGPDDQLCPINLEMTAEALELFKANTERLRREAHALSPDLHAAYSKLEEIPVRLGLIIHEVRVAGRDSAINDPFRVDEASIQAGIELTKWFEHETRRVYEMLRGAPTAGGDSERIEQARRHLVNWIRDQGKPVTTRDVMSLRSRYPKAEDAEAALNDLAAAGLGYWEFDPPSGVGRPTSRFHLTE